MRHGPWPKGVYNLIRRTYKEVNIRVSGTTGTRVGVPIFAVHMLRLSIPEKTPQGLMH